MAAREPEIGNLEWSRVLGKNQASKYRDIAKSRRQFSGRYFLVGEMDNRSKTLGVTKYLAKKNKGHDRQCKAFVAARVFHV